MKTCAVVPFKPFKSYTVGGFLLDFDLYARVKWIRHTGNTGDESNTGNLYVTS